MIQTLNRNGDYNNSKSYCNKKRVRFSSSDESNANKTKLTQNKPILTNTYKGELCSKCGAIRFGQTDESGCKNCLIPRPNGLFVSSKSEFLSRSLENLQKKQYLQQQEQQLPYASAFKTIDQNNLFESQQFEITDNEKASKTRLISKSISTDYSERFSNKFQYTSNNLQIKMNPIPTKPRSNSLQVNNLSPILSTSIDSSIQWTCYACNEPLQPGEVAIQADQVDPMARWHPMCFQCAICNKKLNDLLYYSLNKQIYCEHDYKILTATNTCAACQQPILSNQYVSAENHTWHTDHFFCWDCECSLADQKYILVESKPFCVTCYEIRFSKKCETCKMNIAVNLERFTYENLNWHATDDCFKCFSCKKSLLQTHFLLKSNTLFCCIDCKKKAFPSDNTKKPKKHEKR